MENFPQKELKKSLNGFDIKATLFRKFLSIHKIQVHDKNVIQEINVEFVEAA